VNKLSSSPICPHCLQPHLTLTVETLVFGSLPKQCAHCGHDLKPPVSECTCPRCQPIKLVHTRRLVTVWCDCLPPDERCCVCDAASLPVVGEGCDVFRST
jgi:hypothetical protein